MSNTPNKPMIDTSESQIVEDTKLEEISGGAGFGDLLREPFAPKVKEPVRDGLDTFGKVTSPLYGIISLVTRS